MKRDLTDFERLRAQELLVSRATEGLSGDERDELAGYGAEAIESFEEAAAIVDVMTLPREPLPPDLADKIFMAAIGVKTSPTTAPAVPAVAAVFTRSLPAVPRPVSARPPSSRRSRMLLFAGWAVAAAAAVFAIVGWSSRGAEQPAAISPMASRDDLARTPDSITLRWAGETAGDVVWSAARQRGVIRISGLAANDPRTSRYQVWLFDGARDERYPVDGGLFDAVAPEASVVVTPRIPIDRLTRVLITAEAPNGVVVSDRSRVIASTVGR
jgi:Anti-sigma-K factor rskA